jgi:hypothetical protein
MCSELVLFGYERQMDKKLVFLFLSSEAQVQKDKCPLFQI